MAIAMVMTVHVMSAQVPSYRGETHYLPKELKLTVGLSWREGLLNYNSQPKPDDFVDGLCMHNCTICWKASEPQSLLY